MATENANDQQSNESNKTFYNCDLQAHCKEVVAKVMGPPDTSFADEQARLAAANRAANQEQTDGGFSRAIDAFKDQVDSQRTTNTNIHNTQPAVAKQDAATPAPSTDLDTSEAEESLGLNKDSLSKAGVKSHDDARQAMKELAAHAAHGVSDGDVENFFRGVASEDGYELVMTEIDKRAAAEIDSWNSPTYGTSDKRSPQQAAAANELVRAARHQFVGMVSKGHEPGRIEHVLRRTAIANEVTQSSASQRSPQQAAANAGPRNIHAAMFADKWK